MGWSFKKKKKRITDLWNYTYLSLTFVHGGTSQHSWTQPFKWLYGFREKKKLPVGPALSRRLYFGQSRSNSNFHQHVSVFNSFFLCIISYKWFYLFSSFKIFFFRSMIRSVTGLWFDLVRSKSCLCRKKNNIAVNLDTYASHLSKQK